MGKHKRDTAEKNTRQMGFVVHKVAMKYRFHLVFLR